MSAGLCCRWTISLDDNDDDDDELYRSNRDDDDDCLEGSSLFSSAWSVNLDPTTRTLNFETKLRFDTGR